MGRGHCCQLKSSRIWYQNPVYVYRYEYAISAFYCLYSIGEHDWNPIPNMIVAQLPWQGCVHPECSRLWQCEALETRIYIGVYNTDLLGQRVGGAQWRFCAEFSLCLMCSAKQVRGNVFYNDSNHMKTKYISLLALLKLFHPMCWESLHCFWLVFKDSGWRDR